MKIFCKELKGNEVALDGVEEDTKVADIKKQIENKLNIPGKTSSDFSSIHRFVSYKLLFFSGTTKAFVLGKNPPRHITAKRLQDSRERKADDHKSRQARPKENYRHSFRTILQRQRHIERHGEPLRGKPKTEA